MEVGFSCRHWSRLFQLRHWQFVSHNGRYPASCRSLKFQRLFLPKTLRFLACHGLYILIRRFLIPERLSHRLTCILWVPNTLRLRSNDTWIVVQSWYYGVGGSFQIRDGVNLWIFLPWEFLFLRLLSRLLLLNDLRRRQRRDWLLLRLNFESGRFVRIILGERICRCLSPRKGCWRLLFLRLCFFHQGSSSCCWLYQRLLLLCNDWLYDGLRRVIKSWDCWVRGVCCPLGQLVLFTKGKWLATYSSNWLNGSIIIWIQRWQISLWSSCRLFLDSFSLTIRHPATSCWTLITSIRCASLEHKSRLGKCRFGSNDRNWGILGLFLHHSLGRDHFLAHLWNNLKWSLVLNLFVQV